MSQFTYIFIPVPTTSGADCVTGDVRLADSTVDPIQNTTKGTLQICINKAWGAVCHDDLFGVADARVACQQAGGYEREIIGGIESAAITGPVFVSQLGCEGDETSLLDCRSYTYIGSGCVTADNAVIKCRGMNEIVTKIIQHGWTAETTILLLFVDIDECVKGTDNCSQNCINTIGSYQCYCNDGYTLDSVDRHICNGIFYRHTCNERYIIIMLYSMTYCDYMQWYRYIHTCTCIIEQKFSLQKVIYTVGFYK